MLPKKQGKERDKVTFYLAWLNLHQIYNSKSRIDSYQNLQTIFRKKVKSKKIREGRASSQMIFQWVNSCKSFKK